MGQRAPNKAPRAERAPVLEADPQSHTSSALLWDGAPGLDVGDVDVSL